MNESGGSSAGGVIIGTLIGLAIGLAVGFLYAPRAGEETRQMLQQKAMDVRDRAMRVKDSWCEAGQKTEEAAQETIR